MLGRGTRPYPGKTNCLVMDFAGNTKRLGPINDPVLPKRRGEGGGGQAPVKLCPECGCYNHASVRFCTTCGAEFIQLVKIKEHADELELIKKVKDAIVVQVFPVNSVTYSLHEPSNPAKKPSMRVTYFCGGRQFYEWICLEHDGFAGKKARDWWRTRALDEPPATLIEAIQLAGSLMTPTHIRVWLRKEHSEIQKHCFDGTAFGTQDALPRASKTVLLDEDVPF